jgi:hypothetical protein
MPAEELKKKVDEETSRFLAVGKEVLADGMVDCHEAKRWLAWFAERKRDLSLLKREVNLEMRHIRNEAKLQLATMHDKSEKTTLRTQQTKHLYPYQQLLEQIERLLLEGEKVKPSLEKLLETDCE